MLRIDIIILNTDIISMTTVLMPKCPSITWLSLLWSIYIMKLIYKIFYSQYHLSKGCHVSIGVRIEHVIQDVIMDSDIANTEYFCPVYL